MDSGTEATIFAEMETQSSQTLHTIYARNLPFLHLDPSSVLSGYYYYFLDYGPKEFNLFIFIIDQTPRQFKRSTSFHTEHSKMYQTKFFPRKEHD